MLPLAGPHKRPRANRPWYGLCRAEAVALLTMTKNPTVDTRRRRGFLLAINPLAALVTLLRFDRERGDRAGFKALDGDRLASLLAIAVRAVFDPRQRRVDLGNELALAIPGAQFNGAISLRGGSVGEVRRSEERRVGK